MIRKLMTFSMVVAGVALAQAPGTTVRAPEYKQGAPLACPTGTRQMNGAGGTLAGCAKLVDGKPVFHGPVVRLYDDGKVEAVGQLQDGLRSGKWQMFTKDGALASEIEFLADSYNGHRIEYSNGKVVLDELYVAGKREGVQKKFNAQGVATVTEYRGDHPVNR
ncbi:MAG: hypothetical protein DI536_03745 [Archangium gephyra]|uniref:MORN repeat protein n=1 Tax=Archangium gephyra TaxID=48 RepID=A0A2W5TYQ6_9BACT|nr:MAG: hypothetical protein DI536_03745 [Archangium gephyra]